MLAVPPKSSETRAMLLLSSGYLEHLLTDKDLPITGTKPTATKRGLWA
jgi:hypothetical protein